MKTRLNYSIIFVLLFSYNLLNAQFLTQKHVVKLKVYQSFNSVHRGSELKLALKINVSDSWHINSNKPNEAYLIPSKLEVNKPFKFLKVKFPKAHNIKFSFSKKPVSVFQGNIFIGALIQIPKNINLGKDTIKLKFEYQACNDVTCLPPDGVDTSIVVNVVSDKTPISEINQNIFSKIDLNYTTTSSNISEGSIPNTLASSGLFLSLLLVFLGGLALNLTPCVYPLIPITIGYFGGQSQGNTKKLFSLGVLYVLGIALTYSVVGVVTALSGAVFGTLLQNPIVIIFIVLLFIALGLSQFGVYEFKMPDKLVMKAGGAKSGAFGAFFMGLTMGIVAAPCIGPFVIGLVTYVAAKGDPLYGFLMFFTLAIGLGLPYLFLAIFSGKIKSLPKSGYWLQGVEHIFGLILFGAALYFVGPLLPKEVVHYLLPGFALLSALYLLFIDRKANKIKVFFFFKTIFAVLILGVAVYAIWPVKESSPNWQAFSNAKYENSLSNNHKMIIDFYADWCIPCKELDARTFPDPEVVRLSKNFDNYKVDLTKSMSEKTERIRKQFNILGMPTILIINSKGKIVNRITGFISAKEFVKIISNVN